MKFHESAFSFAKGFICFDLNYMSEISYSYLAPARMINMRASIWCLTVSLNTHGHTHAYILYTGNGFKCRLRLEKISVSAWQQ